MELGLLVDAYGWTLSGPVERILMWLRDTPTRSWLGLRFKAEARDRLQVVTLRCKACGFLEIYAPDEGTCPSCGYDRSGLDPDARCPECGR